MEPNVTLGYVTFVNIVTWLQNICNKLSNKHEFSIWNNGLQYNES
jgi:hypothetical protein